VTDDAFTWNDSSIWPSRLARGQCDRDRSASSHWGIVTEETVRERQIYHWPAGHTGVSEEGVVFLEVGPVGPMRQFGEHARQLFVW